MQKSNNAIIEECRKSNQLAQMQVYDAYCDAMYNITCRYLNQEDAKDAMQEGFLKAFINIKSYKPEFSFGAWLKRIMINQCIDILKKRTLRFIEVDIEDLKLVEDDNWNVDQIISKAQIENAIEQLLDKYKLVVKLYLMEGYDHEEISQILSIPIKTSRTHLRRGRLQLKELLKNKRYGTGY
jgi:RNA polymerase sigma-70 factor (ECF subfamily)